MWSYLFGISRRWEMIFNLCSGVIIVYTLRVNMSVAAPAMKDDLGWSESEKGFVLSAFYWGYTLGQMPASYYAQTYGCKTLFGLSILIPSVLTILVPFACRYHYVLALVVRMTIGFFESASFPAIYHFFPHWIPVDEKTVMVSVTLGGMFVGEIIAFSLSGALVDSNVKVNGTQIGSWPSVFYIFGLLGVLWFPYWMYMAYERPDVHPCMSQAEKDYIQKGKNYTPVNTGNYKSLSTDDATSNTLHNDLLTMEDQHHQDAQVNVSLIKINDEMTTTAVTNHVSDPYRHISVDSANGALHHSAHPKSANTPWKEFFQTPAALTLLFAGWTNGWIGFMLLSEMPSYFKDELGFSLSTAGILCIAPYGGMLLSTLFFGEFFKYAILKLGWETRSVRQCAQFIAFGGAGLTLLIAGFLNNSPYAAYVFIVLSQICLGANQSGLACSYLDIAPNFSGQYNTVGNTMSALAGIFGPIVVSQFTILWPGSEGWRATFYLTAGICVISLSLWAKYQTSDILPKLNNPAKDD